MFILSRDTIILALLRLSLLLMEIKSYLKTYGRFYNIQNDLYFDGNLVTGCWKGENDSTLKLTMGELRFTITSVILFIDINLGQSGRSQRFKIWFGNGSTIDKNFYIYELSNRYLLCCVNEFSSIPWSWDWTLSRVGPLVHMWEYMMSA